MLHWTRWIRVALAVGFLAFQIAAVVYARFVPTRYFCWAPYDQICTWELEAQVNGKVLSANEIRARYRIQQRGRDNRSMHHVLVHLMKYERTYGAGDSTILRMKFQINGKESEWVWSSDSMDP